MGVYGLARKGVHTARFTEKQLGVARLIAEGLTNEEIASRLGVSVSTVKKHIRDLKNQLGIRDKRRIPYILRELGLLK